MSITCIVCTYFHKEFNHEIDNFNYSCTKLKKQIRNPYFPLKNCPLQTNCENCKVFEIKEEGKEFDKLFMSTRSTQFIKNGSVIEVTPRIMEEATEAPEPFSLQQENLATWQEKNFPIADLMKVDKMELCKMVKMLQMVVGAYEEGGELAHLVLKHTQKIREGINGLDKAKVADAVSDQLIYNNQLLTMLDIDFESEYGKTVEEVLARDWKKNPHNGDVVNTDFCADCGHPLIYNNDGSAKCSNCPAEIIAY